MSKPDISAERTCRICGCTNEDCRLCIQKTGEPCHWVAADLCSACLPGFLKLYSGVLLRFRLDLNTSIHELVFGAQHMEQGDCKETMDCLREAKALIERVESQYNRLRAAAVPKKGKR